MKRLLICLFLLAAPLRAGIVLEASTDALEMVTSTAASLDYNCSWSDSTTTAFTPGKSAGNVASATTTTIVAAPAGSTQRNVLNCTIHSASTTTANAVTLQRDVSGSNRTMFSATIAPGETLMLTQEGELKLYSASGIERVQGTADTGYNGKAYQFLKAGAAKDSAGYAVANASNAGVPSSFSLGSPGVNGWTTDCSVATNAADPAGATQLGAHLLQDPASGNLYLTQVAISGSVAGEQLELIDVLWYNTGLVVTTTTAQTFTTPTLPPRDINGSSDGEGVSLALLSTAANTNAGVITATTASYTDSEGNTGATATFTGMVGFQAPATPLNNTWMPFQLAAGDRGVRAITAASSGGITLGSSYGSGSLSAVLYRSLITIPANIANSAAIVDLPSPGLRIYPGTCIWMVIRGNGDRGERRGQLHDHGALRDDRRKPRHRPHRSRGQEPLRALGSDRAPSARAVRKHGTDAPLRARPQRPG